MAARNTRYTIYVDHDPVTSDPEGESRTRQEFADECDINNIMKRYEATGVISHVDQRQPMYVDLANMPTDLAGTLAMLDGATESFMSLPATVRREFDNDPLRFVEFAADSKNIDKMREWGLAKPAELPDAVREPAGEPSSAPSPAGGVGG